MGGATRASMSVTLLVSAYFLYVVPAVVRSCTQRAQHNEEDRVCVWVCARIFTASWDAELCPLAAPPGYITKPTAPSRLHYQAHSPLQAT
jgi:hypothetical protein